jgi:hypothetical protein
MPSNLQCQSSQQQLLEKKKQIADLELQSLENQQKIHKLQLLEDWESYLQDKIRQSHQTPQQVHLDLDQQAWSRIADADTSAQLQRYWPTNSCEKVTIHLLPPNRQTN